MYYELHRHCVLIEGKKRGAIYDLKEGKVFSINGGAVELLKECQGKEITGILDVNLPENKTYLSFLDNLSAKGLGSFYSLKREFKEESGQNLPRKSQPVKLEFLWLELTNACNNRCLHCYSQSSPNYANSSLPPEKWLSLITEAKEAGAASIQFIGGEPLLYPKWRDLAIKARQENYEAIEIFTNATLITDDDIDFFKEHNISIATTIYADNSLSHDTVTLNPGSFDKTMRAVEKILSAGIALRVASIIMKANEGQAENIVKLCEKLGLPGSLPDVVRPTGRGDDEQLLPANYRKEPIKPPFYTDEHSFAQAHCYHTCLSGKIAVTASGDVLPCIFARNHPCGNLLKSSLAEILEGNLLKDCWHTTKDQIEKCQDCEYRYACYDCRPLAQGCDCAKNWLAPSPDCSYNPYTGKWD